MISFKILKENFLEECFSYAIEQLPAAEADEVREIFDSLLGMSEECEVGVTAFGGCLLIRMYDEGYFFVYPIEMTDGADADGALDELRRYSIKEEIPFVLTDVPKECAEALREKYKGARLYSDNPDEEIYVVEVESECANVEKDRKYSFDGSLTLISPTEQYAAEYARLCRDREVNKFWGYDFRADADGCDDGYFLREAKAGYGSGCVATFFVLLGEEFIGEAVLYYFDYMGRAECGVRLLPEYIGKGYGKGALTSLISVAREIGLDHLLATVKKENEKSIGLFGKHFDSEVSDGENIKFLLKL